MVPDLDKPIVRTLYPLSTSLLLLFGWPVDEVEVRQFVEVTYTIEALAASGYGLVSSGHEDEAQRVLSLDDAQD